jgi:hypothetical protein
MTNTIILARGDVDRARAMLRLLSGWLTHAGPQVLADLEAHLSRTGSRIQADDLPARITDLTAMLTYRMMTGDRL